MDEKMKAKKIQDGEMGLMILGESYLSIIVETDSKNPIPVLIINDSDTAEPIKIANGYRVKLIPRA